MKPEKEADEESTEKFQKIGVPLEWIEILKKLGYKKVAQLKEVKPTKLFNDLCGYNKKNQLGLTNPTVSEVTNWLN